MWLDDVQQVLCGNLKTFDFMNKFLVLVTYGFQHCLIPFIGIIVPFLPAVLLPTRSLLSYDRFNAVIGVLAQENSNEWHAQCRGRGGLPISAVPPA